MILFHKKSANKKQTYNHCISRGKLNQSYIQKLQKKEEWKDDYYIREFSEPYNTHRHTSIQSSKEAL